LLEAGDFVGLQKLPKNASPVRLHNRCKLQVDLEVTCVNLVFHVTFRELANNGLIPGVKKAVGKIEF
jgi:small subunit ribosomal protein S14